MRHGGHENIIITAEMDLGPPSHVGCEVNSYGANQHGIMTMWCPNHQQYVYAFPTSKTWHYRGLPDVTR